MFTWIRHYGAKVCALPSALLVTSATEGEGGCVFTPFFLSVFVDGFWTGSVCDKDELIRFW